MSCGKKRIPALKPVHKVPIGGWRYEDPTGYIFISGIKDSYDALDDLEKKIDAYRRGHRLPYENIREEILIQICRKNPDMFYWVDKEERTLQKEEAVLLESAVDLYNAELSYAIKGEQDKRISICDSCPMNKPLPFANPEYETMVFHVTRGKTNENMGYCTHFMHDNRIACFLECSPSEPLPPSNCWANNKQGK